MKTVAEEDDSIRPIVALKIINPVTNKEVAIYALLDTGSDRDVIDERLAKELMNSAREKLQLSEWSHWTENMRRRFKTQ